MLYRHIPVAFAAKPAPPKAPRWSLLAACEADDLPNFVILATGMKTNRATGSVE